MYASTIVTPQDIAKSSAALSMLIAAQAAGTRCLHTSTEITAEEFEAEAADTYDYVLVHAANDAQRVPLGLFGAEIGDDVRRAWLRGPFVSPSNRAQFSAIADVALDALRLHAGERVDVFDAYIETSHGDALDWYTMRGFERLKRHSVYLMESPNELIAAVDAVVNLPPELVDQTTELAARAFPGGYLTRDDFAAPATDDRITLCLREDNLLLGYVYMSYESATMEAQVENIAVLETERRKGYARKLLLAGLHWAFTLRKAPRAALVVTEGNTNAEQLYQSVGFKPFAEGQHLRLKQTD